jgi:hypothetical protein
VEAKPVWASPIALVAVLFPSALSRLRRLQQLPREKIMPNSQLAPAAPPRRQVAEWLILTAILFCGALISAYFAWSEQRLTEVTETARMAAQSGTVEENLRRQMAGLRSVLESMRDAVAARRLVAVPTVATCH